MQTPIPSGVGQIAVWHEIFAGSNKFPQMKITANIFPAKIYSRVIFSNLNSLHKIKVLKNRCLLRSETKR